MEMQWWIWLVFGIGPDPAGTGPADVLHPLVRHRCRAGLAHRLLAPSLQLDMQVLLWVVLSSITTVLWFKLFRRKQPDVRWTADSVIGEVGLLTASVSQFQKGRVRFQKPILGNEEWTCVADSDIPAGERVRLAAIEGNTARVTRA
jgi:membrane protein implicated in regulation of membrane protease activity